MEFDRNGANTQLHSRSRLRSLDLSISNVLYALFGGICAGKTTVANILERASGAIVISKDRLILESDRLAQRGKIIDIDRLRADLIEEHTSGAMVLDETIRCGSLSSFCEGGRSIIGVKLSAPLEVRTQRLVSRIENQADILRQLSAIVGVDLSQYDRNERRQMWRSPTLYDRVPLSRRSEFDVLLEMLYLSGSHYMKPEVPDPVEFPELSYVSEFDERDSLERISAEEIENRRIPFGRYRLERSENRIKCCIWDVGGVLYDFSLLPLERFTLGRMRDKSLYAVRKDRFSFGSYMRGTITFEELVRSYANCFNLDNTEELQYGVASALRSGVGLSRPLCKTVMAKLHAVGVRNVILSNALRLLADTGDYQDQVAPADRFYSFDIGYLKPERQAYEHVLGKLEVQPEDALFIDDKARNVIAAEQLGICSVVFNENNFTETLQRKIGRSMGWAEDTFT